MADEKAAAEGEEPKKKGKLVPIIIGVLLVVGAAVGAVAVTSPPAEEEEAVVVDLNSFDAIHYDKELEWSFNLRAKSGQGLGRLKISFDYKAADPLIAAPLITKGWDKAKSNVRKLLFGKQREDFDDPAALSHLSLELSDILTKAFFPEKDGLVCEVFVLDFIIQ